MTPSPGALRAAKALYLAQPIDLSKIEAVAERIDRECGTAELFAPFFRAAIPDDKSSMADILKNKLSEAAEKLGFREGKEGVTIPPAEWCEEDELQAVMRLAWVRGCKFGMAVARASIAKYQHEIIHPNNKQRQNYPRQRSRRR